MCACTSCGCYGVHVNIHVVATVCVRLCLVARQAKQLKKDEEARKAAEKAAQGRIAPRDMFRAETDKYSQFDDNVRMEMHTSYTVGDKQLNVPCRSSDVRAYESFLGFEAWRVCTSVSKRVRFYF